MLALTVSLAFAGVASAGAGEPAEIAVCGTGVCDVDVSLMQVAAKGGRASPKVGGAPDEYVAVAAKQRRSHSKHHRREVALMQLGSSPTKPRAESAAAADEHRGPASELGHQAQSAAVSGAQGGPPQPGEAEGARIEDTARRRRRTADPQSAGAPAGSSEGLPGPPSAGAGAAGAGGAHKARDIGGTEYVVNSDPAAAAPRDTPQGLVLESNILLLIRTWGVWTLPILLVAAILFCASVWLLCTNTTADPYRARSWKKSKLTTDLRTHANLIGFEPVLIGQEPQTDPPPCAPAKTGTVYGSVFQG